MCRGFLNPAKGKFAVFALFLLLMLLFLCIYGMPAAPCIPEPSLFSYIVIFISLPYFIALCAFSLQFWHAILLAAVYWYILACVYVTAYNWLEGSLRRKYPWINPKSRDRRAGQQKV
jgi:hypothetical protein